MSAEVERTEASGRGRGRAFSVVALGAFGVAADPAAAFSVVETALELRATTADAALAPDDGSPTIHGYGSDQRSGADD